MVLCRIMQLQTVFLHHGQHMCWTRLIHTPASCCAVKLLHSRTSSVLMAARQRAVLQFPALLLWLWPGTVLGKQLWHHWHKLVLCLRLLLLAVCSPASDALSGGTGCVTSGAASVQKL